jgi:Zn-dependent alcohol dehydrogenase
LLSSNAALHLSCTSTAPHFAGIKPVELAPHHPTVEYPLVCGHEVAGVVTWCGSDVEKFKIGDHIGIGALVDSCLACENCDK